MTMTKAVFFSFGIFFSFAFSPLLHAQQDPADIAVNQAIIDQANTIVLRQKLVEARAAVEHGDLISAAKLYEDAYGLTQKIGSGIDTETAQTVSGLVSVHLELASRAQ